MELLSTEKILSLLKEHNISFQLSMDGTRQEQDFLRPTKEGKKSFDAILKNIKLFQEAQKTLSVRATITPYNMQLSKMFLFFKKIRFKRMNFNLCSSSDSDWLIRGKNHDIFARVGFACRLLFKTSDRRCGNHPAPPLSKFLHSIILG